GIQPRDTYNMDETGYQIGVASNQYVYTQRGQQVFIPNANNRELVTLVECISTNGASITPIVIVKAQSVMEHWISNQLDNYLISVSDSGYTNDSLALDWLKHFEKMTRRRQVGAWRLLLVDGHGSHDTKQFAEFAEKYKIQLFALPPHTTYILQPLDVGCFQLLKWYY
ncbi:CENP-B protein, partial [Amniculicola lignicola CBS 123094]